jgi:hypothetical protein
MTAAEIYRSYQYGIIGAWGTMNHEKKLSPKSRVTVSFIQKKLITGDQNAEF